jgi:hypothetical protein
VKPKFYRAFAQWHRSSGNPTRNMTLIVKAKERSAALVSTVRDKIRRLDGALPIAAIRTMDEVVERSIATPKLTGNLLATSHCSVWRSRRSAFTVCLSYVVSLGGRKSA